MSKMNLEHLADADQYTANVGVMLDSALLSPGVMYHLDLEGFISLTLEHFAGWWPQPP